MNLIPEPFYSQLVENGKSNNLKYAKEGKTTDHFPVVKLFCPFSHAIWLISEIDTDNPNLLFGLCDLGFGYPEIGNVLLSDILSTEGPNGQKIARDSLFIPKFPLTVYADAARNQSHITFDFDALKLAAAQQIEREAE